MLRSPEIRFEAATRRVWRGSREVRLTRKAFDLLALLIERRPDVVSKAEIHRRLWPETFVSDINLHGLVSELRRAFGDKAGHPRFIRTVHGLGYAFIGPVDDQHRQADAVPRRRRGWLIGKAGRLSLFDGRNLLGRGVADAIELSSPTISRLHAAMRFDEEPWLEDLGSKNGTFVGDSRVTGPVRLADGNRVRVGSLLFTFRVSQAPGASSTRSDPGESEPPRPKPAR
jgi:DNA-binding winged helix-turn-helix (wHTH) protein